MIQTLEFTAILEVFGRTDESENRYLTTEDVKRLWLDGKYPEGWHPRAAEDMGLGGLGLSVADLLLKRVLERIGF
ncbi:MAG: hypothetical protein AAGD07_17280 [Planctomycetota bacterium]